MLRNLRFFGHIVRSDSDEDHTCALNAGIDDQPKEWRRPRSRPRQTWLHTIENDLKQQNLGLWPARYRAYDREQWREIVETATLLAGACYMMMMNCIFWQINVCKIYKSRNDRQLTCSTVLVTRWDHAEHSTARGKGSAGENMPRSVRQHPDACTRHPEQCWR